jgi:hypothetical protein
MRVVRAIVLICSVSILSVTTALLLTACGFRVSGADFPVLKLSNESNTAQH